MPAIASKSYKTGEVILECKPIVYCVKEPFKSKYCDNCLKESVSLKKCAKCLQMFYCGKECQQTDWKQHKNECKLFKNSKFQMSTSTAIERLLLRLWLCAANDPNFVSKKYHKSDGSEVSVNDLQFDVQKMKRKKSLMTFFAKICDRFKSFGFEFEADKLFYYYGLCFWGFGIYPVSKIVKDSCDLDIVNGSAKIASALYIEMADVGHSCLPNCDYITNGWTLQMRAMSDIKSKQAICVSNYSLLRPRAERIEWLREFRPDVCKCDKCRLDLDKDIDYDELNYYLQEQRFFWRKTDFFMGILFNHSFTIDWDLILLMRAVFGRHHTVISEALLLSFICFVRFSGYATKPLIKVWYKEVEQNLLVTHGSEHPTYRLCRIVYQRNI